MKKWTNKDSINVYRSGFFIANLEQIQYSFSRIYFLVLLFIWGSCSLVLVGISFFKVNYGNITRIYEIYSQLTINTAE